MAADLKQLEPELRVKIAKVYERCASLGHTFRPNFTGRTPWQQARLWRQSRTAEEIAQGLKRLRDGGALFLARVLEDVGPQHGAWATNALPGQSWHNWKPARAVDSFLVREGVAIWRGDDPGYLALVKIGTALGLTSEARIHDYGHLQLDAQEVPQRFSLTQLDDLMLGLWGADETELAPERTSGGAACA